LCRRGNDKPRVIAVRKIGLAERATAMPETLSRESRRAFMTFILGEIKKGE
jgi:hypothetical protein